MSRSEEELQPGSPVPPGQSEPRLLTRQERHAERDQPNRQPSPRKPGIRWPEPLGTKHAVRANRWKSKRLRIWTLVVCAVFVLAIAAIVVIIATLRHALTASLPQVDGSVRVSGLQQPVTVTRDPQGVPTIIAASIPDLLFAQGYITAGDRLWQMDALRRHASGELAEIFGPGLIEHDRRQRYLQIRAAADRAVSQLPADQLAQLNAYARGVNAYIDSHRDALPVEFRLLAYKPAPWSPRDSLLVSLAMWEDLSTEFPQKLNREVLSAHLPPELLPDLYPVGSWRDQPPSSQGQDLTAPHDVEQIPLDPSQSHLRPPAAHSPEPSDLLAMSNALTGTGRCEGCRSGSNNWAVTGKLTASGAPMLSNDMHLSLAIPDIWYEASLHASQGTGASSESGLDATGFTLPGVPFVIVGRNAHVAWGVTNLGADVQDLRIEHLRGTGERTEYEQPDGTWAVAHHHAEDIHVRGSRDLLLDVVTTMHPSGPGSMETPVISPLYRGEQRALSLAWTAYDPAAVSSPFCAVNTAQNGSTLVTALADFGGPTLNLVWADRSGHIGYHAIGRIPVRGPAVRHPRVLPEAEPANQPGLSPDDESSEEQDGPKASTSSDAHLNLRASRTTRPSLSATAEQPSDAQKPVRRGFQSSKAPDRAQRLELPADSAAPLPIDYTIGSGVSSVPVDALDASQVWTEYIPYDALPATVDPSGGFVATANARITSDDYPYAVANDWVDPFRADRIVHLLKGRKSFIPEDMLRIQTDVHSDVNLAIAQRLAYALDHASVKVLGSDAARLRQTANLLRGWNGDMSARSPGAAIVSAVKSTLWQALLVPQIERHSGLDASHAAFLSDLYTWNERTSALELLLQNEPERWLPPGFGNWDDFVTTVTARALRSVHAPSDLSRWSYGQVHTVSIEHPVFGEHPLLSKLVGIPGSTGTWPVSGDGSTISAVGRNFGPSERFTADLSSSDAAIGNITTGQSGIPRSPWYLNQFRAWLTGTSFEMPNARSERDHSLRLLPR